MILIKGYMNDHFMLISGLGHGFGGETAEVLS